MRIPSIIQEAKDALARGEQVVISVVSVSETGGDTGFLPTAISKINTHEIKKHGDQVIDLGQMPEAMIDIAEIRELLRDMPAMLSPAEIFQNVWGDRFAFITGEVPDKKREKLVRLFQHNEIDVLMISGADKTGINLHDITGKRRIHLVVGDFEWSPTTFKQELGRVS